MVNKTKDEQYSYMFSDDYDPVRLGKVAYARWRKDPKSLLFTLSRYKFVSKLLQNKNEVLELGCGDGWSSQVVAQAVNQLTLSDYDESFLNEAKYNIMNSDLSNVSFLLHDCVNDRLAKKYDAIYSLDVIEHIEPDSVDKFINCTKNSLRNAGLFICGLPTQVSQDLIHPMNRDPGHINCMNELELRELLGRHFANSFIFGMTDEIVHTGSPNLSYYMFGIGIHVE